MLRMIIKLTGCLLIIFGCTGIGIYHVMKKAVRIRILRELEKILQYMYGEIEYTAPDMTEMMDSLAYRGGIFQVFFQNIRDQLSSHRGRRFSEYWKEEMKNIRGVENLTADDLEFFVQIGENLGNMDLMTQLGTLAIFQRRLTDRIHLIEKEYFGQAKMTMVSWVVTGIFIAVLLY